jgi:hypothetical protein
MYNLGTIRKFETENFTVIVDAQEENDLDLSFDEDGSVAEGLDSGKFVAFVARARVLFHGEEIAVDYLGGCVYESIEEFMDHRECGRANRTFEEHGQSGRCGSYFTDMIHTVVTEAREHLAKMKAVRVRNPRVAV